MSYNRDPIQGLIDYINVVKPYHTKIAEVRVVYKHEDLVNASISENLTFSININWQEYANLNVQEQMLFGIDYMVQNENMTVTVVDRTSNGGWDMPAWDSEAWSLPFEGPFLKLTQNLTETSNVNIQDSHIIASGVGGDSMGVGVTETLTFVGAAHPTIYLSDTMTVSVVEENQATVVGLNMIGSWDVNYWDLQSYDENLGALINLT